MAAIETGDMHRILTAFALSDHRFLITNQSLLVLGDYVAGRLHAKPDDVENLIKDANILRSQIIEDSSLTRVDVPGLGNVPVLRETDSDRHTSKCPNYPRI